MLAPDIVNYVRARFRVSEQSEALDTLAKAKLHSDAPPDSRMLRCALVTSNNTLAGLRFQVDGLACDFRDVILAAEYSRKHGEWVQTRDFSQPLALEA
jgi:hypothetical protein